MRRGTIAILIILLLGAIQGTASANNDPYLAVKTDTSGVFLTDYGLSFGGLGVQYNPVSIANHALALWDKYQRTSDPVYLDAFMVQARWFYDNQHSDGTWKYNFCIPSYGLKQPWISCMSQGLGMQVLTYAYEINGDQTYLDKAKASIAPFGISVKNGGVRSYFADGTPWYEEYASLETPVIKVLNGYMFALQGMAKHLEINEDDAVRMYLNEGLSSLDRKIALYDAGYISFYDAAGTVHVDYNACHVEQLLYFYKLTNNNRFRIYAKRFDSYEPKKGIRATSLIKGQQDPYILVDGKRFGGPIWERKNYSGQLQIDMGAVRTLDGVNFFFVDTKNIPSLIQMAVSTDGRKWRNITPSELNPRGAYYPAKTKSMYIRMQYFKQPVNARYIRIVLNQGQSKSIRVREIHPMYNQNPARFN